MIKTLLKRIIKGAPCVCPVCNSEVPAFEPLPQFYYDMAKEHGYKYSFDDSETMNHRAYLCPKCQCSDRDRLYALYFDKYFKPWANGRQLKFIDFAPAKPLSKRIKSTYSFLNYRTADLFAEGVDDKIDLTDMKPYADNSVDFFLCSHILEHVSDSNKAMRELYRILKLGGKGIAMVPILLTIKETLEDPSVTTAEERWKHYGQDDHVRIFSRESFIRDLQNAGFKIEELREKDFGAAAFKQAGISSKSVLYIVSK